MDLSDRRGSLSMDLWRCVHIPRWRVFEAYDRTFLGMLHAEHSVNFDLVTEYPVYRAPAPDEDGICYWFSPPAAQRFKNMMRFCSGLAPEQPPDLTIARRIL